MTIDSAAVPALDETIEQSPHPPQMHPRSAANGKYHCKSSFSAKSCRGHSRANTAPAQLPALHYSNTRYQHNNTQSSSSKPNVRLFFFLPKHVGEEVSGKCSPLSALEFDDQTQQ